MVVEDSGVVLVDSSGVVVEDSEVVLVDSSGVLFAVVLELSLEDIEWVVVVSVSTDDELESGYCSAVELFEFGSLELVGFAIVVLLFSSESAKIRLIDINVMDKIILKRESICV